MKRRYRLIIVLIVLIIPIVLIIANNGLFAQQETSIEQFCKDSIEEYLIEYNVPAVGIGVIEDGELRQVKVYGELKKGTPAPDNAIFNVASLSKPISTLLVLHLVSNGEWDLDEPLFHYWVDPDVIDDPLHKTLTTRHVLTHQTGFDNWRRMHESKKLTFNSEPGTKVKYSGEGFEYLRHAIENKFDKPFEELVYSIVFMPYGMNDSRLLWDENMHKSRYAEEHNKEGEPYDLLKRTKDACASDDVLTTIEDYCLFGVNVMNGSGLTEEVYEDMLRLQAIVKTNEGFGLGWYIKPNFYKSEFALMHTGSDAGVAAKVILLPESRRGIVMLTNGDNGFDIINKVEAEFFASGI
jgi:CubicO group peptidase (beta-lactamase class C family)